MYGARWLLMLGGDSLILLDVTRLVIFRLCCCMCNFLILVRVCGLLYILQIGVYKIGWSGYFRGVK